MPKAKAIKRLRVQYVHSSIGNAVSQKRTVLALGLRRLGDVAEHADTPALRGMLFAVRHLVQVEELDA
jgi:large subunit ribosomal protein L30